MDDTILDHLNHDQRFVTARGPITSRVSFGDQDIVAIGCDNGNDALKLAILNDKGKLITRRTPTAYTRAQQVRGGTGITTYQVGEGTPFWIGAAALDHDGDALPIGPTPQRLDDPRQRDFIIACLVEGLVEAGYKPGAYDLALGFAIPNDEIVLEERGDRLGVEERTKQALKKYLRGSTQQIRRTDERGRVGEWTLTLQRLLPQAQSVGTFVCWSRTPTGVAVTDVEALTILDIGGGDLQKTEININPYRMTTQHLGAGTIGIARALKARFPRMNLSDVAAQQALVTKKLRISGRNQDISKDVAEAIATTGQDLIGRMLPILQQQSRYVLTTGGGTVLLHDALVERTAKIGKRAGSDYAIINHGQSSVLNAVGALFAVLFAAAKRATT